MGDNSVFEKPTVLVTGFGPFAMHQVNASWVAVQELEKMGLGEDLDVSLVTIEIPVEYSTVREKIPMLWKDISPQLVVHVGVSGIAKELTLEQVAHNDGYDKPDVRGLLPYDKCCVGGAPHCLTSDIDMNQVCDAVNKAQCGVHSIVSHDPGRYLCDFIYFTSLNVNKTSTAFIHVPPLDRPYSAQQLAIGLRLAIRAMIKQMTTQQQQQQQRLASSY